MESVSPEVSKALQELVNSSSSNKTSAYNDLLRTIVANPASNTLSADLIAYVQALINDNLGIVTSRPLLSFFCEQFEELPNSEAKVNVGQAALQIIQPKVVSYEEQDTALKHILASAYEAQEDYTESAKILQTIILDSSQRVVTDDQKAQIWVRIVRCYLEEDDSVAASTYLNRLKSVIPNVKDDSLRVHFLLSQARIQDSQRNFLDASSSYYTLSQNAQVEEEERLMCLSKSMICAVLAPAGPARARTLARLYKDDRASQIEEFGMMEKIYLDRLLSPDEVKAFAEKLSPHQMALTGDGSTVLDKAVLEHNLLGASRLYRNIGFDQLGELLAVDGEKAEQYAAQMIEQGRVAGYIDQIDRFIFFEGEGSGQKKTGQTERVVGRELRQWDVNVKGLAEDIERVTTMIQTQQPEFYAQHMEGDYHVADLKV
ncbi:COP9 signalosome-like protein complex subunit 4 [Aulographum hederae CBS 113979]|uniref:COP9 signalosome complex subunit 4 n=1 Tax=Aulographum hederae CBS 113979 TaxID=1176131 RepID=A0A6G1H975_9PEZI|nr:COP9 signalosome-like protein complex subunit 4 [Aulographum hederae CBS 113979]